VKGRSFAPPQEEIGKGGGLVKVDSWRLANAWDDRLDKGVYDMDGIKIEEGKDGPVVIRGPRELAEEEY
jgi:hypothetical protein